MAETSIGLQVLLLLATLVTASRGHLLDADGFHNWRYHYPLGPHPLVEPPQFPSHPPLRQALPFLPLHPPPPHPLVIIVPVHVRGSFPPFIERIVQRIQTWWSFYNPPEELTRPPPKLGEETTDSPKPTTNSSKKTPTTTTSIPPTTTSQVPKEEPEAPEVSDTTTSSTDSSVSTLAVFEVTPSTPVLSDDTESPLFITPEGQRDAYLRFLQTGTVPPYLESDTLNDMDDEK